MSALHSPLFTMLYNVDSAMFEGKGNDDVVDRGDDNSGEMVVSGEMVAWGWHGNGGIYRAGKA